MRGPAPKDAAIRQRRNQRSTRATLAQTAGPRKRAPSLPQREKGQQWHRLTRAWWRDVWASPMSQEYVRADEHALYRLAVLIDQFWVDPSKDLAAEIRLQQQAFGLTPLDRRRLEWSIGQAETATTRRQQRKVRQAQQTGEDPREALKAVK
jgi:hypothetical protein